MLYQFTEVAKPLVCAPAHKDAFDAVAADVEKATSIINQKLDSGWLVYSTNTMTVDNVGYIVYVLRRFIKETEYVSTNKDNQESLE